MTIQSEHHLPPAQPLGTRVQHGLRIRMLNPLALFTGLLLFGHGVWFGWRWEEATSFVLFVIAMLGLSMWGVIEAETVRRLVQAGATSADHVIVSWCCAVGLGTFPVFGASVGAACGGHRPDQVLNLILPMTVGCGVAAYLVAMLCLGGGSLVRVGVKQIVVIIFSTMGLSAVALGSLLEPWVGLVLVPVIAVLVALVWFRRHSLYR